WPRLLRAHGKCAQEHRPSEKQATAARKNVRHCRGEIEEFGILSKLCTGRADPTFTVLRRVSHATARARTRPSEYGWRNGSVNTLTDILVSECNWVGSEIGPLCGNDDRCCAPLVSMENRRFPKGKIVAIHTRTSRSKGPARAGRGVRRGHLF